MTTTLRISDTLSLPLDAVTQTIAVVAKRRVGKSYFARRLAEQVYKARQQLVIVDPKGDWHGIRSSRDGKGPGLPIIIIGGVRGDVPLEASGGELVAKLIVEERVSVLIDLSDLRKHEVATFMAVFLETLYRLKNRDEYRSALLLIIDEADAIAPQKPQPNEARMLGAAEDIVRRGGQRGLGCMLITQRTAVLSKNVLTQAQILIALRTIAPQDLAAMNAWIDVHGEPEQRETLMASLPSLPVGDAWVWSPGWPTADGIFERIHTAPIETFDSGATPKPGEKRREPRTVAQVDLDAVRRQMAETIERAKADDPKALRTELAAARKRVAELESELQHEKSRKSEGKTKTVEKPVLRDSDIAAFDRSLGKIDAQIAEFRELVAKLDGPATKMREAARLARAPAPTATPAPTAQRGFIHDGGGPRAGRPAPAPRPTNGHAGSSEVGNSGLRRMLIALAQRPQGLTNRQIGLRAGISSQSGTFATYLSRARQQGWIADAGPVRLITQAGIDALGSYEPLPTGAALREYWIGELGQSGAARILTALANAYPHALTNAEIGEAAEISAASGTFATYMSRLRGLELIQGTRGATKASDELFD